LEDLNMAYKFQIGAARLSGSLVQEGDMEAQGSGEFTSLKIQNDSTIGTAADADMLTLSQGSDIAVAADLDFIVQKVGGFNLADGAVTSTAAELNLLDGVSGLVKADFTKLAEVTATSAEINDLAGNAVDGSDFTKLSEITATSAKINYLDNTDLAAADIQKLADMTATAAEINDLAGNAVDGSDFTKLSEVTSTSAELNLLDAVARGSIVYGNGSGASALLGKGAASTFLQSDGSDIAYVAMSGDATLSAGAITIADNAVTLAKMAGIARGSMIVGDASGDPVALAKGSSAQFAISDGDDLVYRSMSGDATIAANGAVTIAANAVEGSMINANAAGSGLAYGSNTLSVDLQTVSGLEFDSAKLRIDLSSSNALELSAGGIDLKSTIAGNRTFSNDVIVQGDFTVQGGFTSIESATINITSSFTFEGPADAHETILDAGIPTADITVKLPQYNQAGTVHMAVFADPSTAASAAVTAAEFAILDGGSSDSSVLVQAADQLIINDGGVMKQTAMSDIKAFVEAGLNAAVSVALKDDASTLLVGVNYFADLAGAEACSLPASPTVGQSVKLKAPSNCGSGNRIITVNRQGSHTIDGQASIVLESPDAAVEFVYVASNMWKVF
jgi:hypothetical protein